MAAVPDGHDRRLGRWDLFCRVVDHFGDVGIAWRLARQLAVDPRRAVRLFVDGAESLARIEPRFDSRFGPSAIQSIDAVSLSRWPADGDGSIAVADVVVEMLGCGLPAGYRDAMAAASPSPAGAPVWVDYEHLSAEAWVDGFHGLPSPHATLPLIKHFFYPGFGPRTGGLLVEPDLETRRNAFLADPNAIDAFWQRVGVPSPSAVDAGLPERRMSVFAYADAPLGALLDALGDDPRHRWLVLVPESPLAASMPQSAPATSPRLRTIPFADQADYDRLLWACDVNFARGEDSFVRAQAAGRPFVWQAYAQPDAAHLVKLVAFERRYAAGIADGPAAAQRALWNAWNVAEPGAVAAAVRGWLDALPALAVAADDWRRRIVGEPPLVERLAAFVADVSRRHGPRSTDRQVW